MPPKEDKSPLDPKLDALQYLATVLHELVRLQNNNNTDPFRLDTRFQLPKFNGQTNGEAVDSWIRSLSTYFNTCQGLTEVRRLQIASLQLEGLTQTWWATEQEKAALAEKGDVPQLANTTPIRTWNQFENALRN